MPIIEADSERLFVAWREDERSGTLKLLGRPELTDGAATVKLEHFSVLVVLEGERAPLGYAQGVIGGSGGTLELVTSSGTARLHVPAGALSRATTLRIEELAPHDDDSINGFVPSALFGFLPYEARFALPVTVELPAPSGTSSVLRRDVYLDPFKDLWTPPRQAEIADGTARVRTRGLGRFAASTAADHALIDFPCSLVQPEFADDGCRWVGRCMNETGNVSASCGSDGKCECTGGVVGKAAFSGSCESGMSALMDAAAEACEWSARRPNVLPSNAWWEVLPGQLQYCSAHLDQVGGYVWTGPVDPETGLPEDFFDGISWKERPKRITNGTDIRVVTARDGVSTEVVLVDYCLKMRYVEDSGCHMPVGLVDGSPTKLFPQFLDSSDTSTWVSNRVQFALNLLSGLDRHVSRGVQCAFSRERPDQGTSCQCYDEADSDWRGYAGNADEGLALLRRIWDYTATKEDVSKVLVGCGWPEDLYVELRTREFQSSDTSKWLVPECLAP